MSLFLWIVFSPLCSQELRARSHKRPLLPANISSWIIPPFCSSGDILVEIYQLSKMMYYVHYVLCTIMMNYIHYVMILYYYMQLCNRLQPSNMSNCNGLISYIPLFNWHLKLKPCMNRFGDSCWVHMHLLKWLWGQSLVPYCERQNYGSQKHVNGYR